MFKYSFLPADVSISVPREMNKFKCLILIEREIGADYRYEVSKALVKAGCLYSLAWGIDCSAWDDSVDWAFLEARDVDCPDEEFVRTTWHDDETLEETVEFARHCTDHSAVKLDDILVLHFSNEDRGEFIENLYFRT